MVETEVETLRAGGTRDDQKKHGTFHVQFAQLQEQYARLMKSGANSETLRDALVELLLEGGRGLAVALEALRLADREGLYQEAAAEPGEGRHQVHALGGWDRIGQLGHGCARIVDA